MHRALEASHPAFLAEANRQTNGEKWLPNVLRDLRRERAIHIRLDGKLIERKQHIQGPAWVHGPSVDELWGGLAQVALEIVRLIRPRLLVTDDLCDGVGVGLMAHPREVGASP